MYRSGYLPTGANLATICHGLLMSAMNRFNRRLHLACGPLQGALGSVSAEAANALTEPAGPARERAFSKILHKHGTVVSVDRDELNGLLAPAGTKSLDLAYGLGLAPNQT